MEINVGGIVNNRYLVESIVSVDQTTNENIYKFRCIKCGYINICTYKRLLYICKCTNECNHRIRSSINRIGEVIEDQYMIIRECGRNTYNDRLYDFKCIKCGFIYPNTRIAEMRRKAKKERNNDECHHGTIHKHHNIWKNKHVSLLYRSIPKSDMCKEWKDNYLKFEKFILSNPNYTNHCQIMRRNVKELFSPLNCDIVISNRKVKSCTDSD